MRKAIAAIVLLTAFVLYAKNEVPPSLLRSDAPSIEIDVSVRPVTQDSYQLLERAKPGMYRCQAVVHEEPGSHRVWGSEEILLSPGQTKEETTEFGQLKLHFRASIGKRADRVRTEVTLTRDGKVINRQTSSVEVEPPEPLRRLR